MSAQELIDHPGGSPFISLQSLVAGARGLFADVHAVCSATKFYHVQPSSPTSGLQLIICYHGRVKGVLFSSCSQRPVVEQETEGRLLMIADSYQGLSTSPRASFGIAEQDSFLRRAHKPTIFRA